MAEQRAHDVRRARGGAGGWAATLLTWVALALALASLHVLFVGTSWWLAGAGTAAAVLVAALVARAIGLGAWLGWAAGVLVGVLVTTVVVSGGTAIAGVVPTGATLERVRALAASAETTVVEGTAPVEVTPAVLAVVVAAVALVAAFVDLVGSVARLPLPAVLVPVGVLAVPSFVPGVSTSWPWAVATLLAVLLLLAVAGGGRLGGGGLLGAVAAVGLAGLATSLLPIGAVAPVPGVGSGTGLATGVNPIVDLGDDLRRGAPVTVLDYSTDDGDGTYLKLVDLVDFSGDRWSPAEVELDPAQQLDDLPAAPGIAAGTTRRDRVTEVDVSALRSPYLPLPVPPTEIEGLDDDWTWVDESGVTVRSDVAGTAGLSYRVRSAPVDPSPDQVVASLGVDGDDMREYLAVDGVPETVTALAAEVTADAANPFDAAVALQDWFRDGDFRYSEETPVEQGYDGSGLDVLETFLEVRSGYCVHFASAMAVMARTLDIPSRVAVGFLPGAATGVGESRSWSVSSDDLHTWPELWFDGLGWVPFEPTVGLGAPQEFLQETGVEPSDAPSTAPDEDADEPTSAASSAAPDDAGPTDDASDPATASGRGGGADAVPAVVLSLLAVLAALLVVPGLVRGARRRRRSATGPPHAALAAWHEVVDTACDLGIAVDPGATPAVVAADLGAQLRGGAQEARVALTALLAALEGERFGAAAAGAGVHDDARAVAAGLRAAAGPGRRAAALVLPRSLLASRGAPRRADA